MNSPYLPLKDKFRSDHICERCGFHTNQKLVKKQGKENWICMECNSIQPKEEGKNGENGSCGNARGN